jgi:hypothetical protein
VSPLTLLSNAKSAGPKPRALYWFQSFFASRASSQAKARSAMSARMLCLISSHIIQKQIPSLGELCSHGVHLPYGAKHEPAQSSAETCRGVRPSH